MFHSVSDLNLSFWLLLFFSHHGNIISSFCLVAQTEAKNGDMVIEGITLTSNRANRLLKVEDVGHPTSCYMCKLNIDLKHTVSLIGWNLFEFWYEPWNLFTGYPHIEPVPSHWWVHAPTTNYRVVQEAAEKSRHISSDGSKSRADV